MGSCQNTIFSAQFTAILVILWLVKDKPHLTKLKPHSHDYACRFLSVSPELECVFVQCVSPLCLGGHFEIVVCRLASLLMPVLQLNSELVLTRGGEGM